MNDLVFINSNNLNEEPFTTSKIIAAYGQVNHDTVQRLIRNYKNDIEEFGIIGFQIRKPENSKGGRPEKVYKLNEQQATLLISYMQNTEPVREFKKTLVKQFYLMKKELTKRFISREKAKEKRNTLTDALDRLPQSPHKAMTYKHYTDLVYNIVFGKNTKQLRQQYGISDKETPRDYFSVNDIKKVEKIENEIAVLIEFGNTYSNIKTIMLRKYKS
ncbi:Rha family transcriptional regulator [Clostridium felsineum]|uniref:Uncharacterized protein n=1 Tax=Clostridium felsineum TaxID=36839 RepID=A0A1S8LC23_9CLOT|nr:Rha family transcriptional regulator [Clostridium felsineum]URZ08940.1 hypothetical protein CLROS_043440 [Clostridium felsineum]URZ09568.1 hypothetical protein CROST_002490 [Clostridium felsineum]